MASLAAANKRIGNILRKAGDAIPAEIVPSLLSDPAEHALVVALQSCEQAVAPLLSRGDYAAVLQHLAGLRGAVDAYFDQVLVMSDDVAVRHNRLAQLGRLRGLFLDAGCRPVMPVQSGMKPGGAPAPRLVILGRDGLSTQRLPTGVRSVEEWRASPGSLRAIGRLTAAHCRLVVATNQPGVAHGRRDRGMLAHIHARMNNEVVREGGRIEAVFYCPHGVDDGCALPRKTGARSVARSGEAARYPTERRSLHR